MSTDVLSSGHWFQAILFTRPKIQQNVVCLIGCKPAFARWDTLGSTWVKRKIRETQGRQGNGAICPSNVLHF